MPRRQGERRIRDIAAQPSFLADRARQAVPMRLRITWF
jgi:hypothetical protein